MPKKMFEIWLPVMDSQIKTDRWARRRDKIEIPQQVKVRFKGHSLLKGESLSRLVF